MTNLNASLPARFGREYLPSSLLLQIGRRELFIGRDFRPRYYAVNPVVECCAGVAAGHFEVLLFRKWLVIFKKAA
jgi:hypothetical protein